MTMILKLLAELALYALGSFSGVLAFTNWDRYQKDGNKGNLFFCLWDFMLMAVITAGIAGIVLL